MLPQVRVEAVGHGVDARFARAIPVANRFDLDRPVESLVGCMAYADNAFLLDVSGSHPPSWKYRAQAGLERLRGAAVPASCLGEQPDQRFTRGVLIPSYFDAIAADQPVIHRITAVANNTFLAYRKMTIPLHATSRAGRVTHILTFAQIDLVLPNVRSGRGEGCPLSARERQCLLLAAGGLMSKQIAAEMGISEKTVEMHLTNARRKLGARTTAHAVAISLAMALAGG